MTDIVYVAVFSRQEYHYDEEGRSYLPKPYTVFGVYESMNDALDEVCRHFYGDKQDSYTELDSCCTLNNGEVIGYNYTFKYEDKKYGGYAIYDLEISKEYVTKNKKLCNT